MGFWIFVGVIAAACALVGWACCHINKTPTPQVKSHDAIDEEIRRERIELHNTSLAYAEIQRKWIQDDAPTPLNANRLEGLLATAFREGAKWQQHRDR